MRIPIEDLYEDILGKSQAGLNLGNSELCEKSGLSSKTLDSVKSGRFDEHAVRQLAPHLNLDADTLVAAGQNSWYPQAVAVEGLESFNTPYPIAGYSEMTVNAYLVWDTETREAVVFDTGADATALISKIQDLDLALKMILLTHSHGDHIADLKRLKKETGQPPVYINKRESMRNAESIDEGWNTTVGNLHIRAYLTHGHSPGGTTYVITGLKTTIAITGDSMFAGSIGGAPSLYQIALENNRGKILTLPDDTVICPGHGPLSTVGEEKAHNPFFPEFK